MRPRSFTTHGLGNRKYTAAPATISAVMKNCCLPSPALSPRRMSVSDTHTQNTASSTAVTRALPARLRMTRKRSYSTPAAAPAASDTHASVSSWVKLSPIPT